MAGREARSRGRGPLESGFWLKPDPSTAFEAAEAAPRSRARSRLLTSPNDRHMYTLALGLMMLLFLSDPGVWALYIRLDAVTTCRSMIPSFLATFSP
jgi:hypothetical protein